MKGDGYGRVFALCDISAGAVLVIQAIHCGCVSMPKRRITILLLMKYSIGDVLWVFWHLPWLPFRVCNLPAMALGRASAADSICLSCPHLPGGDWICHAENASNRLVELNACLLTVSVHRVHFLADSVMVIRLNASLCCPSILPDEMEFSCSHFRCWHLSTISALIMRHCR